MKYTGSFFVLAVALTLISSTAVHANNGANLIGASAASVGLGGTGVANFTNGTDAMFKNPALLTELAGADATVGVELYTTILKLNAKGSYNDSLNLGVTPQANTDVVNETTTRVIPNVAGTYKFNDKLAVGLGLIGQAGSTSNYPNEPQIARVMSDLTVVRVLPTVAYKPAPWVSIGVSPFIGYGEFALNDAAGVATQSTRKTTSSTAMGVHTGLRLAPSEQVTFGFAWSSKTTFKFKELSDVEAFAGAANGLDDIEVAQPEEFGMGISYKPLAGLTLTADYRLIRWGAAAGYTTFDWKDQNVWAFGTEYKFTALSLRAGVNIADAPYSDRTGEAGASTQDLQGHSISNKSVSILNMFAFPAVAKTHVTVGAGYQVSDNFDLDGSFMYAFSNTIKRSGTFVAASTYDYSSTASLWTLTLGGRYRF